MPQSIFSVHLSGHLANEVLLNFYEPSRHCALSVYYCMCSIDLSSLMSPCALTILQGLRKTVRHGPQNKASH